MIHALRCGCEPLGSYRCREALELWGCFQVADRESASAHVAFGRDMTPATSATAAAASKAKWQAWAEYSAHFGPRWEHEFADGFMAVNREEARLRLTLTEWRAEEKRRERQADYASDVIDHFGSREAAEAEGWLA